MAIKCPLCGLDWSHSIRIPFRDLTCESCAKEKRRRMTVADEISIRRAEKRMAKHMAEFRALPKEEQHRIAEQDRRDLWGK